MTCNLMTLLKYLKYNSLNFVWPDDKVVQLSYFLKENEIHYQYQYDEFCLHSVPITSNLEMP